MKYKKIDNSIINGIEATYDGNFLLCRRNRFDLIKGIDVRNPILKSDNISNASDIFFDKKMNQVLFVNTSGKGYLYDLQKKEKINNIALGHEMFGRGVSSDSKNFYYINKMNRVMKLGQDGEKSSLVFEVETDVDDIIFADGRCFFFKRKEDIQNPDFYNYEVKCYEKEKLITTKVINGIDSINKKNLDYDRKTIVMLIDEPTNQPGWMLQNSIGIFNTKNMEYNSIFKIPNEWGIPYGYATCLQKNLLAYVDGDNLYIIDLKSSKVVDKMSGEYLCSVAFINPKELLVGSWKGLYWAELE